jgi:hypothetical protein
MARDLICSIVLAVLAGAYYLFASGLGRSALADEVGPAGLPLIYAALLGGLAVCLAAKTAFNAWLLRAHAQPAGGSKTGVGFVLKRAGGALGIGAGYVALVSFLGYWLTLCLLIPAMALYQGQPFSRGLVAISVGGASFFWLLFVWLLGIPMPSAWILSQ